MERAAKVGQAQPAAGSNRMLYDVASTNMVSV